jgi:hypothetical protein
LISGDLDRIVMKCLQKDRAQRYDTASALADDVGRFLSGTPVGAQAPSLRYLAGKFARRYRTALVTAAATLLLVVVGAAAAFFQIVKERNDALQARSRADAEERRAREALDVSETNRALAEQRFGEKRQAMDAMLAQFSDKSLSGMPGTHEIRRVLFERGVDMYEKMFRERGQDPSLQLSLADRYAELGRLQSEIGAIDQALSRCARAKHCCAASPNRNPATPITSIASPSSSTRSAIAAGSIASPARVFLRWNNRSRS